MFTLTIETDNDAFVDREAAEIAYILERTAQRIRGGALSGKVIDSNGNNVGRFEVNE